MHASQQSTPLHDAAFNGDITAVKTLIEAGASLNAKNSEGKTPIQVATDKALENDEHWTVVKTIAEVCLGEFDGTKNFSYALSHAILAVKLDVIEALIRAGTDLSAKNSEGKTPIQVAAGKAFADPKFWPVVEKIAQTCPGRSE